MCGTSTVIILVVLLICIAAEDECERKFYECLASSATIMQKFIDTDIYCCKKLINDDEEIWRKTFYRCTEDELVETYFSCIHDYDQGCYKPIIKHLNETEDDYQKFHGEVMKKIEHPQTEELCDESFADKIEENLVEQCQENKYVSLEEMCDVILNYYSENK
ncbi:uncharacterized protein [Centruroides vittatus]|uniref:uncharacterized protein n=1 Tax=Centruroides vittatus TaxID=120091 RepID=UPI003510511A